jgi:hypothetical protein
MMIMARLTGSSNLVSSKHTVQSEGDLLHPPPAPLAQVGHLRAPFVSYLYSFQFLNMPLSHSPSPSTLTLLSSSDSARNSDIHEIMDDEKQTTKELARSVRAVTREF